MDSELGELIRRGEPDDVVEALVRLRDAEQVPGQLRVVSRFGSIVSARVRRGDILAAYQDPGTVSMKAPRFVAPPLDSIPQESAPVTSHADCMTLPPERAPEESSLSTVRPLIGMLDFGFDVTHPLLIHGKNRSKFESIWIQGARNHDGNRFGYGRSLRKQDIDSALEKSQPFAELRYHPDPRGLYEGGTHGTHVAGIMAQVAPEADFIAVHLGIPKLDPTNALSDSSRVVDGLAFIVEEARGRPCTVNMSVGTSAGSEHAGRSLVEQAIDSCLREHTNIVFCQSVGNYFDTATHISNRIRPGERRSHKWYVDHADTTPNEMDVWFAGEDRFAFHIQAPDGGRPFRSVAGGALDLEIDGEVCGRAWHRLHEPNSGLNTFTLYLFENAPTGTWGITLEPLHVSNGRYHAWIERDNGCSACQSRFDDEEADRRFTTNVLANSELAIASGAYDPVTENLGRFSSSGPSTDGRMKPEIIAPGVGILSAKSASYDEKRSANEYVRMSGTSMASPHTTASIALARAAASRPLTVAEIRTLLQRSARRIDVDKADKDRIGFGALNTEKLVSMAIQLTSTPVTDFVVSEEGIGSGSEPGKKTSEASTAENLTEPEITGSETAFDRSSSPEESIVSDDNAVTEQSQALRLDPAPISEDNDIVIVIQVIGRPGDVGQFWADRARPNRNDWDHPLSELELSYVQSMRASSVPNILRMRAPVNPSAPSQEERAAATRLFGGASGTAMRRYANYENRRRILAHYVWTHPATVRLQLGLYRLVRDVNPLHFALERGWQIGSGREMFTRQEVSRLGAAFEFVASLALVYGIGRVIRAVRPSSGRTYSGDLTDPIYDLPRSGGMRVNGRWYTEHALERMAPDIPQVRAQIRTRISQRLARLGIDQNHPAYGRVLQRALEKVNPRGVPPSVVEAEIIRPGSTNVRVITANRKQVVVTVIPRRRVSAPATESDTLTWRVEINEAEVEESGPPAGQCTPFLPPAGGSYTDFVRPPTYGSIDLLINGRDSGGSGPDVDRTEPLDAMQRIVQGLSSGDSVYLSAWFFGPATALMAGSYRGVTNWGLLFAAKAAEGVKIRILINDFDPISGMDRWLENDSLRPMRRIVAAIPVATRDNLKFVVSRHPASFGRLRSSLAGRASIAIGSHHQKFMVVRRGNETTAFCGGLDIESRKVPASWSYGGLIGWHDLHLKLKGPITRDLETEFVMRWNRERSNARNRRLPGWRPFERLAVNALSREDRAAGKRRQRMQMTRTVSSGATVAAYSNNRRDIRESYRRIINCAARFLYLENQYYRDISLADDIVRRGREVPELRVIIVVVASAADDDGNNQLTRHGDYLQYETLRRIAAGLGSGRVGIYTMMGRAVHSKLIIADDRYLSIGSANANVRSFDLDSELNVTVDDASFARSSRLRLWSHNLGESQSTVRGWRANQFVNEWNRVSRANRSVPDPRRMRGEGVVIYNYAANRGRKSPIVPDYLVNLDLAPERPMFAGLPRQASPNRRIA